MSKKVQNQEEEIDLGGFFNQIGKLFLRLFEWIGDSFKGMYHFVIMVFIFVKNHYIKLSIGAFLGIVLGFIAHKNSEKSYVHQMVILPNYESGTYIKNKLDYYNHLIKQKDYKTLSQLFSIDTQDAESIADFEIEPIIDQKDLVEGYDELVKKSDTTTIKEVPLKTYIKKNFSEYNYKKYVIRMLTSKPNLKKNISTALIKDLENNKYLIEKKALMLNTLAIKDSTFKSLLKIIDTIIVKDKKIAQTAASTGANNSSSINLNNKENYNKDYELLQLFRTTSYDLAGLNEDKIKYNSLYQVLAPMEPIGKEKIGFVFTVFFKVFSLVILLTIALILFKPFLKYLDQYKKQ